VVRGSVLAFAFVRVDVAVALVRDLAAVVLAVVLVAFVVFAFARVLVDFAVAALAAVAGFCVVDFFRAARFERASSSL